MIKRNCSGRNFYSFQFRQPFHNSTAFKSLRTKHSVTCVCDEKIENSTDNNIKMIWISVFSLSSHSTYIMQEEAARKIGSYLSEKKSNLIFLLLPPVPDEWTGEMLNVDAGGDEEPLDDDKLPVLALRSADDRM